MPFHCIYYLSLDIAFYKCFHLFGGFEIVF